MGDILTFRNKPEEIENCVHKNKHNTMSYDCPNCAYVGEHLRKNIKQNGDTYIIDYSWKTYNRSGCYKSFDGRNEGGAWDCWEGNALLNKHFQLIDHFNGKLVKTIKC